MVTTIRRVTRICKSPDDEVLTADLLILSKANWKSLCGIRAVLKKFADFSGLQTNQQKSGI